MYCYKCGERIQDDALFCFKCGSKQNSNSSVTTQNQSNNISNEALKIYFSELLTLECIKNKLQNKVAVLENEIQIAETNNYCEHFCIIDDKIRGHYLHVRYDGEDFKFAAIDDGQNMGPLGRRYKIIGRYRIDFEDTYNWNPNYTFFKWLPIEKNKTLFETAWLDYKYSLFGEGFKVDRKRKEQILKFYDNFKKDSPVKYQKNLNEINKQKQKLNEIKIELEQAMELLHNAYAVNIVPIQFRNIYAVYYLCDFINSSNESLATALLNYNLEIIKEKLDKIIEQQQEIIINQAIMMAQNEKVMKQNEQQLCYLSSIEQNTERAAQYAQIAANNAEACAWIGIANYIR